MSRAMRPGFAILLLSVLLALTQVGCVPDPCDEDALGCEDGGELALADDCELSGPLEVTLGQGMSGFEPLPIGAEPILHEGAQGGHHLCLGLRVGNPALDHPQLAVTFEAELYDEDWCAPEDTACDPWVGTGTRDLVLGPELPLNELSEVEQTGLILIISIWPDDIDRRVRVDVEDPCGRTGSVMHAIPPAS